MPHPNRRPRHGLSLVETVVALGIFGLITLVVGSFTVDIFKTNRYFNQTLTATEQARTAMNNLVAELRTASISSLGAYPIAAADTTSLTFYGNIDQDAAKERLRYFVQDTTLKRGVLKPTGSPLTYNPANETVSNAVQNLVNTSSIFSYFDASYNGQTAPLVNPPTVTAIRLVRLAIQIDANPNESPTTYQLSSEVNLRTLKDNL